jgi:hypothetical protein
MVDADVPDIASVVSRIQCVHTRYCVQYLVDGMHDIQQNSGCMMSVLQEIRNDVKDIRVRDEGSARLWPAPPDVILASSHHSSGSSSLRSSLSSDSVRSRSKRGRESKEASREDHDVWVMCPFCHQEHWNEKSHVQHVQRSVDR